MLIGSRAETPWTTGKDKHCSKRRRWDTKEGGTQGATEEFGCHIKEDSDKKLCLSFMLLLGQAP